MVTVEIFCIDENQGQLFWRLWIKYASRYITFLWSSIPAHVFKDRFHRWIGMKFSYKRYIICHSIVKAVQKAPKKSGYPDSLMRYKSQWNDSKNSKNSRFLATIWKVDVILTFSKKYRLEIENMNRYWEIKRYLSELDSELEINLLQKESQIHAVTVCSVVRLVCAWFLR